MMSREQVVPNGGRLALCQETPSVSHPLKVLRLPEVVLLFFFFFPATYAGEGEC